MLIPAGVYVAVNAGGQAVHGWGIPMATDIAFALGILALFGTRAPIGLKVFLTALAIADDIGAVLVIAFFYTANLKLGALAISGVFVLLIAGARASRHPPPRHLSHPCGGSLAERSDFRNPCDRGGHSRRDACSNPGKYRTCEEFLERAKNPPRGARIGGISPTTAW